VSTEVPSKSAAPGSARELWQVAWPLILSSGSLTLMQVVDRLFLTWYSADALAAAMPASMLHWTLLSIAFGTANYVNTFVAQYEGAKMPNRVAAALWQGIWFSAVAGVFIALWSPFAQTIFGLIGHDPAVQTLEAHYFGILCLGSAPMLIAATLACFYSGREKTRVVMWVNVVGSATNTVLDPLFIFGGRALQQWVGRWLPDFGWSTVPEGGIQGAAWATVIGESVMCLCYLALVARGRDARTYGFWSAWRIDRELFGRLLRFGLTNGCHWFVDVLGFSVFIFLIGGLGRDLQAATNLAFNLNTFAFLPMLGVGTAVMVLVGKRIGEKRPNIAIKTTYRAFGLAAVYMLTFGAIYVFCAEWILLPYTAGGDPTEFARIEPMVRILLRFVAVYSLFDAMAIIFGSAVRGAGDTRFPMFMSLLCSSLIMVLPTYIALNYSGLQPDAGIYAAWSACTVYVMVLGTCFLLRFRHGKWKSMRVIETNPPEAEKADPATLAVESNPAA
jgi:MATE family multidrug resistance protein